MTLLEQFLDEDCEASIANRLLEVIEENRNSDITKEFTFNRFNLRMELGDNIVYVEDDLNPNEDGIITVSLEQFEQALKTKKLPWAGGGSA